MEQPREISLRMERSQDSSVELLSSLEDISDNKEGSLTAFPSSAGNNYDAFYSSISTFFSEVSGLSDLTDANEDDVRRLRDEFQRLQSKVVSNGDEMPVNDLVKTVERLLKVEEELVVEEDNLKHSRSTRRESMSSASESSSVFSFEEEDFKDEKDFEAQTSSVHPMQNLVTTQDMQDCAPTPRVGNKKSLPSQAVDMIDSATPRIGNKKALPIHTAAAAAALPQRWESEPSQFLSPRPVRTRNQGIPQRFRSDSLSAASDHGGLRPVSSSSRISTRWARSASMKSERKDSTSASDALNFNVKLDRANSRRKQFVKKMGDEHGMSRSTH